MPQTHDLLLGVDGGNTKTIAVVARRDGTAAGVGKSGLSDIHGAPTPSDGVAEIVRAVEAALAGAGPGPVVRATALGAASSSCSYAAIAIAKSLFQKGASAASALAFQFASTNLVWELGLVLWVLLGWQFTLAEYLGGLVMIALMAALLRLFVSPELERRAREHARTADAGHQHHAAGGRRRRGQEKRVVAPCPDPADGAGGEAPEAVGLEPLGAAMRS